MGISDCFEGIVILLSIALFFGLYFKLFGRNKSKGSNLMSKRDYRGHSAGTGYAFGAALAIDTFFLA